MENNNPTLDDGFEEVPLTLDNGFEEVPLEVEKKNPVGNVSPNGGKVGESVTPSTGNETAELLGVRPAPKTMQELKQVGVVPKDEKTAQQRVNTFKQQLPQKQATFELEKKKIDDYDTAIEELRKKGDEASLKEADELIGIRNKALATYNKAAAEKQIVENEIGAAESSFREKYGAGNRASYIYNAFLRGIGQMSSGVADAFVNLATQIPGAVSPSMNKEEAVSEIRKEVLPVVREGLKKEVGAEVVTEKEKKYNDEFWTSAIAGLSSSVPAMASPYGAGLYAQAYDSGLESINSIEAGKKLPETTKTIFAASVGAAQGLLEKYGLDKIFGKQSAIAARKLAADAISELLESGAKNITKEAFESAINKSVKGLKDKVVKAGGKIGEGVLVEFGTGSAQEASTIAAEKILNASQPNDIFEPKSWGEEIGRILYSGAQESVGGGLMAATVAPFSKTRNYIAEKVAEAKTQEDYQALRAEFANNVSPEEAEVANKIIDYYANVNNKIPENTPNRKEVIESIVEREDIKDAIAKKEQELEQVDEAFKPQVEAEIEVLNGRIGEINENIVNLSSFQPETILPSKETESPAFETDATEAAQPIELSVNEEEINTQPNEQTTQEENGQPLSEGVSSVRTETEERQTSPELRTEEKEVTPLKTKAYRVEGLRTKKQGKDFKFYGTKDLVEEFYGMYEDDENQIQEHDIEYSNPLQVELPNEEFSDPKAEAPYLKRALKEGYDAVVFTNKDRPEDQFYAILEKPSIKEATLPQAIEAIEAAKKSKKIPSEKVKAMKEAVKSMGKIGQDAIFVEENFDAISERLTKDKNIPFKRIC